MSDDHNACLLCREDCKYYGIGECNHAVCAKCAIRLMVVCRVSDCAVCRHKSSRVLVTKARMDFNSYQTERFIPLPDEDLLFEDQDALNYYQDLNNYRCYECSEQFNSMSALKRHVNNEHKKHFCKICIEHLKLFPSEHQHYDLEELSVHKRWTPERPNYGHPKCRICSEDFYDAELWYNHLRRQHFMCHICENLPNLEPFHQQRTVYASYEHLNRHFVAAHFVCQEGQCQSDQFTNVFATENELRAHRISHHSDNMDKALLRETRRLNIDFRYQRGGAAGGSGSGRGRGDGATGGAGRGAGGSGEPQSARSALDQLVTMAPGVREFAANALAASAAAAANGYAENPAEFPSLLGESAGGFARKTAPQEPAEEFPQLQRPTPHQQRPLPAAAAAAASVPPPVYSGPARQTGPGYAASLAPKPGPGQLADMDEEYPSLRPTAAAPPAQPSRTVGGGGGSVWGSVTGGYAPSAAAPASAGADFPSLPKSLVPSPFAQQRQPRPAAAAAAAAPPAASRISSAPVPAPRTRAFQQSKPELDPDPPPEYRPEPGLRYGHLQAPLQPERPTVYQPVTSVSVAPAVVDRQQQQQQQKKLEKKKASTAQVEDDFPVLAGNRFGPLSSGPAADIDLGDDWSAWPVSAGSAAPSNRSSTVSGVVSRREYRASGEDFPSLGGGGGKVNSGAQGPPAWHKDGRRLEAPGSAPSVMATPAATPLGLTLAPEPQQQQQQKKKKKKQKKVQQDQQEEQQQQQQLSSMVKNSSWSELLAKDYYTFSPPQDVQERHARLLQELQQRLSPNQFTQFARASSDFLAGRMAASAFVSEVSGLVGDDAVWRRILPDLITTLPSIERQQDLRLQLRGLCDLMAVCCVCGQTLLPSDADVHRCCPVDGAAT